MLSSSYRWITAALLAAGPWQVAHAGVVTLTFEGAGNLAALQGFYGGATDSQGNAGPDLGVRFGDTALAIVDEDVPGKNGVPNTGNFGNEPSPDTVLFFLDGLALLNYAGGFRDGFSFFYSSTTWSGVVSVYDEVDAGGTLLGTIPLEPLGEGMGDPTGSYNRWQGAGLAFDGIARSVAFGGTADRIAFDNVTFGAATPTQTPVPAQTVAEPSTLALCGLALLGTVLVWRRNASANRVGHQ